MSVMREKVGFENGQMVQIAEDDPSKHNSPGLCNNCGKSGDLKCPHCNSTNVVQEAEPAAGFKNSMMEKFRRLLLHAHDHKNSKYYLGCIFIAIGDPAAAGVTMTDYAKRWGVTRAAVSKECCGICSWLGTDPSPYMKSEKSKKSFRQSNRRPIKRK